MATAKFYLRDPKAKKKTSICLDFSYDSRRLQCSTKLTIDPKNWSKKQNWPKHQITNYSHYNGALLNIQSIVEKFYLSNKETGLTPTVLSIKEHLFSQINKTEDIKVELWDIYDRFISFQKKKVKGLTIKKYDTLKKVLKEFSEEKSPLLDINKFDSNFEVDFCNFLNKDKKQLNVTVSKNITCLKVFLKWAEEEGYHQNTAYQKYKSKSISKDITVLTEDELKALLNLDLTSNTRLARTRDKFLFQCFTGQRFSDIENLRWNDIRETEGKKVWHLYQQKGNKTKPVRIPLVIEGAREILLRQENKSENDKVFPSISNQKFNVYIKELCKLAEIKSIMKEVKYRGLERVEKSEEKHAFISSHTARRTFITLAIEKGIPHEIIMEVTGQEDYRTLKKYIAVSDKTKTEQLMLAFGGSSFLS